MNAPELPVLNELAGALELGALLEAVSRFWGEYELVDHWQQGEFHHDVVVRRFGPDPLGTFDLVALSQDQKFEQHDLILKPVLDAIVK